MNYSSFRILLSLGFCLLTGLAIQGCREPIDFDIVAEERELIVDGFITDQFNSHLIRLSYTASVVDNIAPPNPATGAIVEIYDDLGNLFEVHEDRRGNYYTTAMRAEEGRAYQIVVTLNQSTYRSSFEALPPATRTPNLEIFWDTEDYREVQQGSLFINRQGLSVNARIDKSVIVDRQPVYYQWFVSYCRREVPLSGNSARNCLVFGDITRPPQLYLHKDNYIPGLENTSYLTELNWFPKPNRFVITDVLVVEVDQFLMNASAFDFWSRVQNSIESRGTLFDPAGASILGNVEDTSTGNLTLGYFGVYREAGNWEKFIANGF